MPNLVRAFASRSLKALPSNQGYRPGDLLPLHDDGNPQWREWDDLKAITEGFRVSPWVAICARRRAISQGSVPWLAFELAGDAWEPRPEHPLTELLEEPNMRHSRSDLMHFRSLHMDLSGNALWSKVFINKVLVELWPMVIYPIEPIPSKEDFISAYRYMDGGVNEDIPAELVCHFMYPDPGNLYWGMGRLQSMARSVDTESEARDWNKWSMRNRAVTDGVFSFEQPLSQDLWEEARDQVRIQHQGSDNARAPWVLGSGAKWHQMGLSPVDMDFIEGLKMGREEIAAGFDTPLPLVGVMEDATLANYDASVKSFWENGILPDLDAAEMVINRDITPHFGAVPSAKRADELRQWVKSGSRDKILTKYLAPARRGKTVLWAAYDTSKIVALRADNSKKIADLAVLLAAMVPLRTAAGVVGLDIPDLGAWADEPMVGTTLQSLQKALQGTPGSVAEGRKALEIFRAAERTGVDLQGVLQEAIARRSLQSVKFDL